MAERNELHPKNKHNGQYDFTKLTEDYPPLKKFVSLNPYGSQTIDFFNPQAVKALNKALLISYYGIRYWDIPKNYLCPPIPGRADYIHYIAELIGTENTATGISGRKCLGYRRRSQLHLPDHRVYGVRLDFRGFGHRPCFDSKCQKNSNL